MSKYEEALERARKYYKETTNSVYNYKDMLEQIFPDIEESEDRKIKEEIVNYFQCQSIDEPCRKHIHDKWIAWLEKQGEKPAWGKDDEYRVEILYALCEEEMNKSSVNSTAFRELQETRNWLNSLKERMGG